MMTTKEIKRFPTVSRPIHVRQADTSMGTKIHFPMVRWVNRSVYTSSVPLLASLPHITTRWLRPPPTSLQRRSEDIPPIPRNSCRPTFLRKVPQPDRACHDECQQNPTMGPPIRCALLFSLVSDEHTSQDRLFPRFTILRDGMARRLHDRRVDCSHGHSTRSGPPVRVRAICTLEAVQGLESQKARGEQEPGFVITVADSQIGLKWDSEWSSSQRRHP